MANYIVRHGTLGCFWGGFRMRIRAFRLLLHACVGARRMRVRHRAFRENAQCMRTRCARACRMRTRVARAPYAVSTARAPFSKHGVRHARPMMAHRRLTVGDLRAACSARPYALATSGVADDENYFFSVTIFRVGVKLLFLY